MLEAPLALPRLEVLDVAHKHGYKRARMFAPARSSDVDFSGAAHSILVEPALNRIARFDTASDFSERVEEIVVVDALQERDHLTVRSDDIRDVEQREPHLRRDVVRDRLRDRVGRILLAKPAFQLVVEPPDGVDTGHDDLDALRVEQHSPMLGNVRLNKLEQRRP